MTHYGSVDVAIDLSRLAVDIAGQPGPVDMIRRITQVAVKLVDCATADLIRVRDTGQPSIIASSDPDMSEITMKAWRRWPHTTTPGTSAVDACAMVLQRSSYLQQLRADTGIVRELIVRLQIDRPSHCSLRFLFTEPFEATVDRALITAFCGHAAIAMHNAALLDQVASLHAALDSNREIGAAVGVLMARHQLSYAEGLNSLKVASQNANLRLHDVASNVLRTGDLPVLTPARLTSPGGGHRQAQRRLHSVGATQC